MGNSVSLQSHHHLVLSLFSNLTILTGMWSHLIVFVIFISLMVNYIEHIFMHFFDIYMSLAKSLSFANG